MKKYLICPGEIRSDDGDINFISASRLMELYKVKTGECFTIRSPEQARAIKWRDHVVWEPRADGNYSLPI